MQQVKIQFISPGSKEYIYWGFKGKNLWETIALCGIEPGGTCGGKGTCGKCKVRVEGEVNPISDVEKEHLLPEEIKRGDRLACYCTIKGPLTVYLDYAKFNLDLKISAKTATSQALADHIQMSNRKILIPGLEKHNPVPIHSRLQKALPAHRFEIMPANLNELSKIDRVGRPSIELYALVFNNQIVMHVGKSPHRAYGVAVDLGSTSLFTALIDMENGQIVAMSTGNNMQRVYGADIISRISYTLQNPGGLENLQNILINNLNTMVGEMIKETDTSFENIYQYSIVGNPVMLHFLLGLNVQGFSAAPYSGVFLDELVIRTEEIGLFANNYAKAVILPQIGGFIGADTVGCMLAISNYKSRFLMIDIGTNGEILLFNRGKMWAASAAAGPAFEGGAITSGVRAGNGVIDKVELNEEKKLEFNLLGEKPIRGICGSALIDLCACLLEAEYIDKNGIISPLAYEVLKIREGSRGAEIILIEGDDVLNGLPIVFNQEDIRQVQLAKAAIRTAIDILLNEAELDCNDLDKIYLAGAFGNYLNPRNSIAIGLIPPIAEDKIVNIGNAAGQGAISALLSPRKRKEAKSLRDKVNLVELANREDFEEIYIQNLGF